MDFYFTKKKLEALYCEGKGRSDYPHAVVRAFFKQMRLIDNVAHENELRTFKGSRFEKLSGETNKYSVRLNQGYRLTFSIGKINGVTRLEILEISNHYE